MLSGFYLFIKKASTANVHYNISVHIYHIRKQLRPKKSSDQFKYCITTIIYHAVQANAVYLWIVQVLFSL